MRWLVELSADNQLRAFYGMVAVFLVVSGLGMTQQTYRGNR